MKTVIDLKSTDLNDVIKIMQKYNGCFPTEIEHPAVMTLRLRNMTNGTDYHTGAQNFEITFRADVKNKIVDIHYEHIGFAVSAMKHAKPFDMRVRMGRDFFDRVTFIDMPKDMETYTWLISPTKNAFNGNNAEFIVFMCHCAGYCLGAFPFALDSKVTGDTITYTTKPNFYKTAVDGIELLFIQKRKDDMLAGWDCVNIDWQNFWKMTNMIEDEEFNGTFDHLAFEHLAVRMDDMENSETYYFYDINPRNMTVEVSFCKEKFDYISVKYKLKFWYSINPITGEKMLKWDFADPSKINKDSYENLTKSCGEDHSGQNWSTIEFIVRLFLYTNTFMIYYKDVATNVEEKVCMKQSESKPYKHHSRGTVRMYKSYTLKKNWKTQVNRKKAEIHCLAWGVRGHFRHYKNGKTIFVNAYVKGKERNKYQGKDYMLLPKEA